MRTSSLAGLAFIAASLAFTAAHAAPARASTGGADLPAVDETADPLRDLTIGAIDLIRESTGADKVQLVRTAANRNKTRRARTLQTRRTVSKRNVRRASPSRPAAGPKFAKTPPAHQPAMSRGDYQALVSHLRMRGAD